MRDRIIKTGKLIVAIHMVYLVFFIPNNWLPYIGNFKGDFVFHFTHFNLYFPFTSSIIVLSAWFLLNKIKNNHD